MIDIFAKWKNGIIVCVPKKRKRMSKEDYQKALDACVRLNDIELKKGADKEPAPKRSEDDQLWLEFMDTNASTKR